MKITKYYLTSDEIIEMVDELLKKESAVERYIVLYGMMAQCVCDLSDVKWENCNDLYDEIVKQGMLNSFNDVENFKDVKAIVEEELGVSASIREFTKTLGNNMSDVKLNELMEKMQAMKDDMK